LASKPRALGAITDFAYNLGVPRYRSSTLRRRIEAEDWDGAQEELLKWNRAGGRILNGLVRRRQAECAFLN
jgi:lysozyme